MCKINQKGVSLIEIVVGVFILSIALVAAANAVIKSLQAAEFARNKTEATKLSTQALEWIRIQKANLGWADFSAKSGTYCLNDSLSGTDWQAMSTGNCADYELNDRFKREIVNSHTSCLSGEEVSDDVLRVDMTVSWGDGAKQVRTITCFNKWNLN
jgi:prepilin-type N-terminal cleavage/methylation domain-containing protein